MATAVHDGVSGPPKLIAVTTKPVAALSGRLSVMTMLPPTGTLLPPAAMFGVSRKVLLPPVSGLPLAGTVMALPTVRSPALRTLPENAADGPEVPVAMNIPRPISSSWGSSVCAGSGDSASPQLGRNLDTRRRTG